MHHLHVESREHPHVPVGGRAWAVLGSEHALECRKGGLVPNGAGLALGRAASAFAYTISYMYCDRGYL